MIKTITVEEALSIQDKIIFVDTRSPKEFEEDNIPGSISIPLFSNEERAIVGTLYKQNQVDAYKKGIDIYNEKLLDFVDQFKQLNSSKKIVIYCWRGGMRSKTITQLVSKIREETYQLVDGYKKFREHVRTELQKEIPFELIVLQGLAGCGKTDLIKQLTPTIDLEGLAQHRSSLFGAIGLTPVSQKNFESRLWHKLEELKNEKTVFIEGEARKIGDLFVPGTIYTKMQSSKTIRIVSSIEKRCERIVRDYFTHNEDEQIKIIIQKLNVYLTNKVVDELCQLIDKKKYAPVAKVLLEDYYDGQYQHALESKTYSGEVNTDNISLAIKELEKLKKD